MPDNAAWQDMKTAPRDGTQILTARNTGCGWEYHVVWWTKFDKEYPWASGFDEGYAEERLDYWTPIPAQP